MIFTDKEKNDPVQFQSQKEN